MPVGTADRVGPGDRGWGRRTGPGRPPWKQPGRPAKRSETKLPPDPANPLPGTSPKELKAGYRRGVRPTLTVALSTKVQRRKWPEGPAVDDGHTARGPPTADYPPACGRKRLLTLAPARIHLGDFTLNQSDTKDRRRVSPLTGRPQRSRIRRGRKWTIRAGLGR